MKNLKSLLSCRVIGLYNLFTEILSAGKILHSHFGSSHLARIRILWVILIGSSIMVSAVNIMLSNWNFCHVKFDLVRAIWNFWLGLTINSRQNNLNRQINTFNTFIRVSQGIISLTFGTIEATRIS